MKARGDINEDGTQAWFNYWIQQVQAALIHLPDAQITTKENRDHIRDGGRINSVNFYLANGKYLGGVIMPLTPQARYYLKMDVVREVIYSGPSK